MTRQKKSKSSKPSKPSHSSKSKSRDNNSDEMARLPPLPPGLPPKPSSQRMRQEADVYRPRDPSPSNFRDAPAQNGMYHFRGAAPGTSYYPNYDERLRSPPRWRSPPRYSNDSRPSYNAPGRDDYSYRSSYNDSRERPAPRQELRSDYTESFTFRQEAPPRLDFDQPRSYRSREEANGDSYRANNRANTQRGGMRGGYRGRGGPRMASEREFLRTNRAKTPDLMPGMDVEQGTATYKDVDNMSDSDEAEMDFSSSDDEGDAEHPRKKQKTSTDGNSVPRWSNPDPYTVLPPTDSTDRKKKDVLKMIRKARVPGDSANAPKTEAAPDDFISFDFGEEVDDDLQGKSGMGVEGTASEPRGSAKHDIPPPNAGNGLPPVASYQQLPPLPSTLPNKPINTTSNRKLHEVIDLTSDPNLGSRKRTRSDELKPPPKIHGDSAGKGGPPPNGVVLQDWLPISSAPPTPWVTIDHSGSANLGVWLHKEIMDFYHYVKPRDFEQAIRQKLVDDLREKVKRYFDKNAEIMSFGSFPAGLYLPTADMDLVCVSSGFLNGGAPTMIGSSTLYRFARFVKTHKLALHDQVDCIPKAKVPLVKYICAVTGLKVDISFENDTGLIANKTFQDWKIEFPAMPVLVTLIKHFLAMRGLNEPVNGGIGGFSVICLVVSLLQHMPQVQSRTMVPEHHLGEVLMEFLDLYGNQFNTATTAIQLRPPAYIPKSAATVYTRNAQQQKFCIIDPNKPDNDISGGSSNTVTIRRAFSEAFDKLTQRMGEMHASQNRGIQSLLGPIIGGNYTAFEKQRAHLAHVHEHLYGRVNST